MKFCALQPKCKKQIPFDGPPICPKHGVACPTCKGRRQIIQSWSQAPGEVPRHKTCPTCKGKGIAKNPPVIATQADAALGALPTERLAANK